jgi:hypothetical protein
MMGQLLARYLGFGIAYAITVLIMTFDRRHWLKQAHNLARNSDIALPPYLEWQVARFLREQYVFGLAFNWLVVPPLVTAYAWPLDYQTRAAWLRWYPWAFAGMPTLWILFALIVSAWPRWQASGRGRVTHLGNPMSVRQAFTPVEHATLVMGVLGGLTLGGWGLWRLHAPISYWVVCTAAYVGAVGAWWRPATIMMNRPSSASDILELGWDDLLRFQRVRVLTAAVAWLPALVLLPLDAIMSSDHSNSLSLDLWPIGFVALLAVVLYQVFRQGRHLWRRAWEAGQPGIRPPG